MSRPFIPVANTVSIELIYALSSVLYENVLHVQKGSPYTLPQIQATRAVCDTWDSATGKNIRTSGATLQRIRIKGLDSLGSPFEDFALPTPRAGTLAGSANLPNGVAFCCKLATGLTGRSNRGRIYVGGLNVTQLASSVDLSAAAVTAILSAYTTLKTNLLANGDTLVVVSYMTDKVFRSAGVTQPITSIVAVDNHVDSQRRRLAGRGI